MDRLKIDNVSKIFKSRKAEVVAVDNVSFEVKQGEVFGLIGTNGAGKTTMLRMIATTLKPSFGDIFVGGESVIKNPDSTRKQIGLLFGGDTGLYDRFTARENIQYFGRLYGLTEEEIASRILELTAFFHFEDYLDRRCVKFSRGMKQKTAFARAIVHNPDLMLFDEPSSGLDVIAAEEVIDFIKSVKSQGKTVLLSSHDMQEVEEVCDRIGIISKGKLKAVGTIAEILEKYECATLKKAFIKAVGSDIVKEDVFDNVK